MSSTWTDKLVRRCLMPLALGGVVAFSGCASGTESDAGPDAARRDGGARMDSGAAEDGGPAGDAGEIDGGTSLCAEGVCPPFQFCDDGTCREFPACRGDGTCDVPGDVCHNRHCVPGDVDVDGDGFTADVDCDETNVDIHPGGVEICNDADDDCNDMIDDGDPTDLCTFYPGGGTCMDGSCGCVPGRFDLDPVEPGCECAALPTIGVGETCADAIDVGDISDLGMERIERGNVLPDDREVWYRFRGVDESDSAGGADNYFVDIHFNDNPDNTFEFTVVLDSCSNGSTCADVGFDTFSHSFDFRETRGGELTGEAPCWSGTPVNNVSQCVNDSTTYFVRVRRRAGSNLSCLQYEISFNNGVRNGPPPLPT